MFGFSKKVEEKRIEVLPQGLFEMALCTFDERKHLIYHAFSDNRICEDSSDRSCRLCDPKHLLEIGILNDVFELHAPLYISAAYGNGLRKYLHILPHQGEKGHWRFLFFLILASIDPSGDSAGSVASAFFDQRVCLLLVDPDERICSVSSQGGAVFGFSPESVTGQLLGELLPGYDSVQDGAEVDSGRSVHRCILFRGDGRKHDVDIFKYSASEQYVLYVLCDVTAPVVAQDPSIVAGRERRRIGQDLHDSIGQVMTGISLLSRSLANSLKRSGRSEYIDASQISSLADDASNQIRQISRGLIPSEIVQKGLVESLRELACNTQSSCNVKCDVQLDESIDFSDGAVESHLFRIAQEAVSNAVRHSGASRIEISLSGSDGTTVLKVKDDGTWKKLPQNLNGIGLKTMEYRAAAIGGHLDVGAVEQGGSCVVCSLNEKSIVSDNGLDESLS